MAGPATLTVSAVMAFLLLAIIFLYWWYCLGGGEAVAKLICAIVDLIGSFLSWLVNAIATTVDTVLTTAIGALVDTIPTIDEKGAKAMEKVKDLLKTALLSSLIGPDNVYWIFVINPGYYDDFAFGQMKTGKGTLIHIPNERDGDITYKYGTTIKAIRGRYSSTSYVGKHMFKLPKPDFWYIFLHTLISVPLAEALEKMYIHNYRLRHNGLFPPGNTKYQ